MKAPNQRQASLQFLTVSPLDVLVIGGGIVGAGVARDAAMRGMKTGLVERHDFAFGTSGRSSRLLHGGIRYLAQGRLKLVRESSVEKKILHRIAPHLAEPLPFLFPVWRGTRDWKLWQLKIGVKIYDLLCGGRNLGKSTWLGPGGTLQHCPGLKSPGLKGAVRYFDGFTNDARLVIDTLRSAANHGAAVVNYCRFRNAQRSELWECEAEDVLTGAVLKIRSRAVVNATGPWSDGLPHSSVKLRLTKGVHLVVDRSRLSVPDSVVMTEGQRILFAIPWGERTILGTTDTDYSGVPEEVTVEPADTAYILTIANRTFPGAGLTTDDVISAWAGVRPLIADGRGGPSDISRAHEIRNPEPGWRDVAGGKLTTYRLMAEQTVDAIRRELRLPRLNSRTAAEPLLAPDQFARFSSIIPPPCTREAIQHFVRNEWAVHLDDIMSRRTSWLQYGYDLSQNAEIAADWTAEHLGWTTERRAHELDRCRQLAGWTRLG